MGDYKRLDVWELASGLAIQVYNLTFKGKLAKDFSFRDQIRRAAISVPSNIAEGEESGFDKVGVRYFFHAKASLAELNTQLIIAHKINYIETSDFEEISESISSISKMLRKLIDYRVKFNKKN
ncbi:MAG: four helix bundle protein [Bacteroidales bacterium]|jgi:four helix bundle protein|nr:four helix bundle protein [Bacteroidales bacterium]